MIRPVIDLPPWMPPIPVPDAGATFAGVRDGPRGQGSPADRRHAWLKAHHPGGTIGRLRRDQLVYAALVNGTELARNYDDPDGLMDLVDQAEAEGRCPLHPLAEGSQS